MVFTARGPLSRATSFVIAVVLVLAVGLARPARAFAPPPVMLPVSALAGGAVLSGATATGSAGTVAATGAVGIASGVLAPLAIVVGGAAIMYVGYRYFAGDGLPWEWANASDPDLVPADGFAGDLVSTGDQVIHPRFTVGPPEIGRGNAFQSRRSVVAGPRVDGAFGVRMRYAAFDSLGQTALLPSGCSAWGVVTGGIAEGSWWLQTPAGCDGAALAAMIQSSTHTIYLLTGSQNQPNPDGYWQLHVLSYAHGDEMWDGDPSARAIVRTSARCENVNTGASRVVVRESPAYAPTAPLPLIPGIECNPDERIKELEVERVVPGTNVPPRPLILPLITPQPGDYPDWLPETDWPGWDGGVNNPGESDLRVIDIEYPDRMVPPGWWWWPDRESRVQCEWETPTGLVLLPLEECAALAPQPPGAPLPELPEPTPDGQPPTAPEPGQDCMTRREEEGGFGSWIVFRGVACALQWAFVPQQTPQRLAQLQAEATARPPVSTGVAVASGMQSTLQGWAAAGDGCTQMPELWRQDGDSYRLPCTPPHPVWQGIYATMTAVVVAAGVWGGWTLVRRAVDAP